jgi:hypothetical protein
MSQLSPILRGAWDSSVMFWCPGCKAAHRITYGTGNDYRWGWNGDVNKPTFTPSVLVRTGHYAYDTPPEKCWCTYNAEHPDNPSGYTCQVCHSFVTNGRIQFLSDCTHALAGQTVDLPEWPL